MEHTNNQAKTSPSVEQIEDWLINALVEQLEIDASDIDISDPFSMYGIGSADAMILVGDLQRWLNRQLPVTLLWDYPTIQSLAQHLAQHNASS